MNTRQWLQIFVSITVCATGALANPPDHVSRQNIAPSYQDLHNTAQERGTVRVIARFKTAEPHLSSAGRLQALSRVKAFTDMKGIAPIKSMKRLPLQVYVLDSKQLDAMLDSGLFEQIEEDRLNEPTLIESMALINGGLAHNFGLTGNGAVIGILDTGVDASHATFGGRVVEEACFSTAYAPFDISSLCPNGQTSQTGAGAAAPCAGLCSHGTHVASIAAGQENGDKGPGVAPGAGIIAVQVFSHFTSENYCGVGKAPCVLAYDSDAIAGLEYVESLTASYNVAAINLSLGGGKFTSACDSSPYKTIFDDLAAAGVLAAVASGNDGYTNGINSPGCVSTALSVGSVGDTVNVPNNVSTDVVSNWSNSASFLDILAPGSLIRAAVPGGGYAIKQGTSMATPHVAGAAALIKANSPAVTVAAMKSLLISEAATIVDYRNGLSFPRLDLGKLTVALAGPSEMPTITISSPTDGSVIAVDEGAVGLAATASDPQDGDLSGSITWSSNMGGVLVSPTQLSAGHHVIEASVNDSVGFYATDAVSVDVVNKPSVQILLPASNTQQLEGQSTQLLGSATDTEDGDRSSLISWDSTLDGPLGVGATLSASLVTIGTHVITATVFDSDGHFPTTAPQVLVEVLADTDGDSVPDAIDNCPLVANTDQADFDGDGIGNLCDDVVGC